MINHPVRSSTGGFAASFLVSRPPRLGKAGNDLAAKIKSINVEMNLTGAGFSAFSTALPEPASRAG